MTTPQGEPGPSMAQEPERLLVAIVALGAIAALFLARSLDDSRLTSWRWAFAEADPVRLYALVVAGIVVAYAVARWPLPGHRPAAVLFVSSYAIATLFWREPEVIVDASRYFTQAKHLEVFGLRHFLAEWGRDIPAWTDLPLVPLLYGLIFTVFGESRVCIQAFTTLLFAASVVLTYRIGRTLWDEEVGFLAGALLLAIPYLLTQVPSLLVDVPSMFFLTLALLAVIHASRRPGAGSIVAASLAVFLALFSKYSTWLMLSVLPVIGVVHRRGGAAKALHAVSAIALFSGSLAAAVMLASPRAYSDQIALLLTYQVPGLRRWGESFLSTFLFQVHPFLTVAALLSIWVAFRRRDPRYAIAVWPVVLLLALGVQRIRYWVPAFPMLALLGAYGLQAIRTRVTRRFIATCAVACSLVVALYGYLPFLEGTSAANLKRAGEYLDSIEEKRAEVFALSGLDPEVNPAVSVPILDLFTSKKLTYACDPSPPRAGVEKSPLRFTWAYRNPGYYATDGAEGDAALVVISDHVGQPLPGPVEDRLRSLRRVRVFAADEGVFRHRTVVEVYRTPFRSGQTTRLRSQEGG